MVLPGDFFRPDYFYQFGTGFSGAANGKGWDFVPGPVWRDVGTIADAVAAILKGGFAPQINRSQLSQDA